MYDRILFPTDGSETAGAAFGYALDVASEHGATVHVLNVADTTRDSLVRIDGEVVDVLEREGERVVEEAADRAFERSVSVVTDVLQGDPSETIVDYAAEYDMDLVVMPTHGRRGLERVLLGSVTERVVSAAEVPVLTVTPDEGREPTYPPRSVLVPTDGSRCAGLALEEAVGVTTATGASLDVLHVVDTASLGLDVRSGPQSDELEAAGRGVLADAVDAAESAGAESVSETLAHGNVYREILSYVEESDVDLVVLGTHGRTGFDRYLLGSVAAKLVRTSPVPVLLVRDPDVDGEPDR